MKIYALVYWHVDKGLQVIQTGTTDEERDALIQMAGLREKGGDYRVLQYTVERVLARSPFIEEHWKNYLDGKKLLKKARHDRDTCKAKVRGELSRGGVRCGNKAKYNGYCGVHKKQGE